MSAAQMPCEPGFLCRLGRKGINCVSTAPEARPNNSAWPPELGRLVSSVMLPLCRLWICPCVFRRSSLDLSHGRKQRKQRVQQLHPMDAPSARPGCCGRLARHCLGGNCTATSAPDDDGGWESAQRGVLECEERCGGRDLPEVASGLVGFPRPGFAVHDQGSQQAVQGQGRPRLAHCVHGSDSLLFDGPSVSCLRPAAAAPPPFLRCNFAIHQQAPLRASQRPPTSGRATHRPRPSSNPPDQGHSILHLHRLASRNHTTGRPTLTFPPPPPPPVLPLHPPPPSPQWHATSLQQSSTSRGSEQQL